MYCVCVYGTCCSTSSSKKNQSSKTTPSAWWPRPRSSPSGTLTTTRVPTTVPFVVQQELPLQQLQRRVQPARIRPRRALRACALRVRAAAAALLLLLLLLAAHVVVARAHVVPVPRARTRRARAVEAGTCTRRKSFRPFHPLGLQDCFLICLRARIPSSCFPYSSRSGSKATKRTLRTCSQQR